MDLQSVNSNSLPLFYQIYIQLVFAASGLYFVEWVRSLHYRKVERTILSKNFMFLCFATFVYSLLYWFRLVFPGVIPFIHMRHLNWIASLLANTFYLETIRAYLEIDNKFFRAVIRTLYFFTALFIVFELEYLITGTSLLFLESSRLHANIGNVLAGVHTSSPTLLMKVLSVSLGTLVIMTSVYLMKLALRAPGKEFVLKIGVGFTLLAVMNELLNSMQVIESVTVIFLSKGLEIFRISEYLNRIKFLKLQSLKQEIGEVSKRAATAFIASGLMHDLRNPMTVIVAYLSKFRTAASQLKNHQNFNDDPQLQKIVERLDKSVDKVTLQTERIQAMISSYLEIIRQSNRMYYQDCRVSELLQEALELSQPRIEATGTNRIEIEEMPAVSVNCVRVQSEMIFANIINNAVEAIKGDPAGKVKIGFSKIGTNLMIKISNTGEMSPEVLRRLSKNEFFSTKGEEGNGIGLRIISELCRANGADLQIFNSEKWTNLIVTFPIAGSASLVAGERLSRDNSLPHVVN